MEVQVVPKGTHLVPPSGAVDELGHNPLLKKAQASLNRLYYEQATLQGQAYNDDNDGDGLASPSPMLREGILDDDEGSWA